MKNNLIFPNKVGDLERNVSENMKLIIKKMLAIDEKERPLVKEILIMNEY